MRYSVVLFYSTSGALHAEKLLKGESISVKLIPIPRHLSSDCGICLRFEHSEENRVRKALEEGGVETMGIYEI